MGLELPLGILLGFPTQPSLLPTGLAKHTHARAHTQSLLGAITIAIMLSINDHKNHLCWLPTVVIQTI